MSRGPIGVNLSSNDPLFYPSGPHTIGSAWETTLFYHVCMYTVTTMVQCFISLHHPFKAFVESPFSERGCSRAPVAVNCLKGQR